MIITSIQHILFPILIAALIGYVFIVISRYKKGESKKLYNGFKILLYLNIIIILLIVSTFFNESRYSIEREVQHGHISSYPAHDSGVPFSFLEVSSTEACSFCYEGKIKLIPFLLNLSIFTAIILPLLYVFRKKLKPTKNKFLILGTLLLVELVFLYAFFLSLTQYINFFYFI